MEASDVRKSSSPKWKRPEEVMKFHRLKQKKRALSARLNGNDSVASIGFSSNSNSGDSVEFPPAKRRNPFARRLDETNTKAIETTDESGVETDISSDTTLFHLLNSSQSTQCADGAPSSFANILKHISLNEEVQNEKPPSPKKIRHKDGLCIPIDWSIKNKLRFMSSTPFSWSGTLRTCEQASSVTGFVRCLDTGNMKEETSCTLDTSPNARFHQCCLYWQHPNIPWLELFPRSAMSSHGTLITAQLQMAPALLAEWTTAFKSLFQLVRTRQCPFFYLIANNFYCLFQAAGVAGIYETHVLVTPTGKGFRKMLEKEGVVYSMPLDKNQKMSGLASDSENSRLTVDESSAFEDDDDDEWVDGLSLDSTGVKRITSYQRLKDRKIDESCESLLLVEGIHVQAFFNMLLNCKSCITNSGPYAAIPPTLISPTAFSLATLKSCKVRDSMVHVCGSDFYSIQIEGPIMPHSFRQICILLEEYRTQYSASLSNVKQSLAFTNAFKTIHTIGKYKSSSSSVFVKENLSDCGLSQSLIGVLCEDDPEKYEIIEKIEPKKNQ